MVASMVAPFIALPLSECTASSDESTPSPLQTSTSNSAASSLSSRSCTAQPTIFRLQMSWNMYR